MCLYCIFFCKLLYSLNVLCWSYFDTLEYINQSINQSYSVTDRPYGVDGLTNNSLHASSPTNRTRRTPHLPPPLFTHWPMIGKSNGTDRAKPTDRNTRREHRRSCFVARVFFTAGCPSCHQPTKWLNLGDYVDYPYLKFISVVIIVNVDKMLIM